MKVYFTGSPRALKVFKREHETIYEAIEKNGGSNLSDFIVKVDPKAFEERSRKEVVDYYNDNMKMIKKADIVVMEVSLHSMSLGFLINKALEQNKLVIALYLPENKPFFLGGIENERLRVYEYTAETVHEIIKHAFDEYNRFSDARFNFFISPEIGRYLDWISKNRKQPRAVFLRSLLEKAMKSDKEFNGE